MTDKIQQARRAAFEAWVKTQGVTHVESAYLAFSAALDCVVIELPDVSTHYEHSKYMHGVRDSRAAIESTNLGLRVK